MAVLFVSLLFMTASATAEVFFLKEDLEVSDAIYGVVFGAWTIGMVLGALVVARRVPEGALALGVPRGGGDPGLGLGLPTVWLAVGFGAGMWLIGGLAHGTKNVLARTLIQERVPDRLHGRAFAAYNGLRNGAELFALAGGGVLVAAIGGRATLALAGGIPILAALAGLASTAAGAPRSPPRRRSSRSSGTWTPCRRRRGPGSARRYAAVPMKAIQITELSGPDSALQILDLPEPEPSHMLTPGSGIVVDVHAAGVSFPEVLQTRGEYQLKPPLPFVPGSEVAGVVRSAPTVPV